MCDVCVARTQVGRRRMVLGTAGLLAAASLSARAHAQPVRAAETPAAALTLLQDGNARYVANKPQERDFSAGRVLREKGQKPFAAILSCADSRIAPELAFDQGPGDLFVVRVAGNFVTTEGLGSLEFGAAVLGTPLIMVLGHSKCGAVNATIEAIQKGNDLPGHIADLVEAMKPGIAPAVRDGGDDLAARATIANVKYGVERLRTATPILSDLVAKGGLLVVGGVYRLSTGTVEMV